MRSTVVPAQITTVEDKIAGNITVQQAMILGFPVLIAFAFTVLLPPFGNFTGYKVTITTVIFVICCALAIRIKDRLVVQWLILFARYCARPRYYVYDKNTSYLRSKISETVVLKVEPHQPITSLKETPAIKLSHKEFARLEQLARDSRASLKFDVSKKGELNVRITEVQ